MGRSQAAPAVAEPNRAALDGAGVDGAGVDGAGFDGAGVDGAARHVSAAVPDGAGAHTARSSESGASAPGRVAARLARQVEVGLAAVDLTLPQYRVLMYLDEGEVMASRLADHLAVSRPTVTAVVDGLVMRGLVERSPDSDDRRRVSHTLTVRGRQALEAGDLSVEQRLRQIAGHAQAASGVDRDVVGGLECWRAALDEHRRTLLGRAR